MKVIFLIGLFFLGALQGSIIHWISYRMPQYNYRSIMKWKSNFHLICIILMGLFTIFPLVKYYKGDISLNEVYFSWVISQFLLLISMIDIYYQVILNKVLLLFTSIVFIFYSLNDISQLKAGCIGALFIFVLLYILFMGSVYLFKKECLGGGDVKLYGVLGLLLGPFRVIISLFLASLLALVYLLIVDEKRGYFLSFGPFISISAYISLFYGQQLAQLLFYV